MRLFVTPAIKYTLKLGMDAEPVPDPNGLKVVVTKAGKNGEQV